MTSYLHTLFVLEVSLREGPQPQPGRGKPTRRAAEDVCLKNADPEISHAVASLVYGPAHGFAEFSALRKPVMQAMTCIQLCCGRPSGFCSSWALMRCPGAAVVVDQRAPDTDHCIFLNSITLGPIFVPGGNSTGVSPCVLFASFSSLASVVGSARIATTV